MDNQSLIDQILGDDNATPHELELADRLHAAMAELDRLTNALSNLEAPDGPNP